MRVIVGTAANELRLMWRSARWLTTMLTVVLLALGFFPPMGAAYSTFVVDGRGVVYSVGVFASVGAVLTNVVVAGLGLFLLGDATRRDAQVRVLETLSSTCNHRTFGIGRMFGSVAMLWTLDSLAFAVITILAVIRGGVPPSAIVHLAAVYFPITLALPPLVGALATGVDTWVPSVPLLRMVANGVIYVSLAVTGVVMAGMPSTPLPDPLGISTIQESIVSTLHYTPTLAVGLLPAATPVVSWPGVFPGDTLWIHALLWTLIGLSMGSVLVPRSWPENRHRRETVSFETRAKWLAAIDEPIAAPRPVVRPSLWRSVLAEVGLALKLHRGWYWAAVIAFAVGSIVPLSDARPMAAIDLLLPLMVLPSMVGREQRYGTDDVIDAMPALRDRYVVWKAVTAIPLALAPASVLIIREAFFTPVAAWGLLAGLLWTAIFLVGIGVITRGPMIGLTIVGLVWYVAAWNPVPEWLDYAGLWHLRASPDNTVWLMSALLALSLATIISRAVSNRPKGQSN